MGSDCTSSGPTITAIRDLTRMRTRSLGGVVRVLAATTTTVLLCQLLIGAHCLSVGSVGSGQSDPFIVQATIDDQVENNVLVNEVEELKLTCER